MKKNELSKKQLKKHISHLNLELQEKNSHIEELRIEVNEFSGFKRGKIWQLLTFFRLIKKSPRKLYESTRSEGIFNTIRKILYQLKNIRIGGITPDSEKYNEDYQIWIQKNQNNEIYTRYKDNLKKLKYRPLISIIIPVYNVKESYLREAIESVFNQIYPNWELCISDDASTQSHIKRVLKEYKEKDKRIKVVFRKKNGHISKSSNSALKLATGKFIGLLDNDDIIHPQALYKVVKSLNKNRKLDLIYSDEDKLELEGRRTDPFFKPDWSPDLFLSSNYLCHFTVIRKKLVDRIGGFRAGYEGSQDYDLFLRITELTNNIHHIPDILYSWRKISGSTAVAYDEKSYANQASLKAIKDTLSRRSIKGHVKNGNVPGTFRIKYSIEDNPKVSIIIPTKDSTSFIKKCIYSILENTFYKNFEILITDTGSKNPETQEFYSGLETNNSIKIIKWHNEFNYSAVNNFGASQSQGKYLIFLNNDTEVLNPSWISSMLEHSQRKEVGAVGAQLLYKNKTIQHAGVILGLGKDMIASHIYNGFSDRLFGLPIRKDIICNYSAVTGACMMVRKKYFNEVGGFTEDLKIYYNDVDLCLKLRDKGLSIVYTPYSRLFHYESVTIKSAKKRKTINKDEIKYMKNKWGQLLLNDPFSNPNLTLDTTGYKIRTEQKDLN